jgi:hypothetical protein
MPTVGATIQLYAFAWDQNGGAVSTSFSWSTTNSGVATVNGSGLVTGAATGICSIKAIASDSGVTGTTSVGVALLSQNSLTIANGSSTTISSVGGFKTINWDSGAPGAAQIYAGVATSNGQMNPGNADGHNDGNGDGAPTATIVTGIYAGPTTFTATAHVPIFANIGGIYCQATANVTGVSNWAGN